jgi:hypothetical protein
LIVTEIRHYRAGKQPGVPLNNEQLPEVQADYENIIKTASLVNAFPDSFQQNSVHENLGVDKQTVPF